MLPDDDKHFLLELDGYSPGEPTVYKVSLDKKQISTVQESSSLVREWITDRQHLVRIGIYRNKTTYHIKHQQDAGGKLATLWEFEEFSDNQVWPIGFGEDKNELYIRKLHNGRDAIFRVKLDDPKLETELVLADEKYDLSGSLIYSQSAKKVVGISVTEGGGYIFWDDEYKSLQAKLNKSLPKENINYLYSFSKDENSYLAFSTSDIEAGTYLIGNKKAKTLSAVAFRYNKLAPELMSPKKAVSYKAKDGLEIEGFLTLPRGAKEGEKHPTIIFPHGGPISHDNGDFDYWA